MTSRENLTAVHLITELLHEELCMPGSRPDAAWSDAHMRVDRWRAVRLHAQLVTAGLIRSTQSDVLADDFLVAP